ncbi:MAG: hypothetical protein PHH82_02735 [Candidatus ainarchaeum sp.]|nr:hypothetical protein [Candidatus ainarchaeum sp.]
MDTDLRQKKYLLIIIGVILFLLRFVPIYPQGEKVFSLSYAHTFCGSILGGLLEQCNLVLVVDWIVIIASVVLVVAGLFLIYKEGSK